ncbi:DegT/DnrJ/EryC1/StrS family aminotransferase [Fervidobacterium thailandense]|nr:DegT/DnrJ/EryC1/StrS family aminotransferase [Fervidobacterium thailandense]
MKEQEMIKAMERLKVPLSRPQVTDEDVEVVVKILKSGRLSLGPYLKLFEEHVAEYVGARYAVAVSSGTAALHLILKALDFSSEDVLIVPSFTFVASANVALFEKGDVVFVDIEPVTMNLDPTHLEVLLEKLAKDGKRVFLMAVDIFGHPIDWDAIYNLKYKYNFTIVEDSCEALGSEYKGRKVGTFGIAGAFAFYPNKQITTGEGGVLVTDDEKIAKLAKALRNQGRSEGAGWLEHEFVGYNYRMDELSAGLGWSQIKRIDDIIEKRNQAAQRYTSCLRYVELPVVKDYVTKMSWFVYVVKLPKGTTREQRNKIINYLNEQGIEARNYFEPVHLQRPYRELGWSEGTLPVTEEIAQRTVALPFYTDITVEEQEYVAYHLEKAIEYYL